MARHSHYSFNKHTMLATPKTAALAGAWAALGLALLDVWIDKNAALASSTRDVLWLLMLALFVALPFYFMVLGTGQKPFSRNWISNPEERARYGVIAARVLVWLIAAAAVGAAWALIGARLIS